MIEAIRAAAWGSVNARFKTLEAESVNRVVNVLVVWLATGTRKKPLPDLSQRLAKMNDQIRYMAERLVVNTNGKTMVVTAPEGRANDTLVLLNRGSDWFDGHQDVVKAIANAVFNEQ